MEFKEVLMDIRKELRCADKYAHEAVKHKAEFPELADVYHKIAADKTTHAEMLSRQAKAMAEKHHMMPAWEIEEYMMNHDLAEVKRCMADYRG
jgi:hypothetical protein